MKAEHEWNFTSTYAHPLRTNNTHLASGQHVITDAPVDNHGLGQAFSPTDLLSTSLASCVLTIMGIHVNAKDYELISADASIQKTMAANPRRVAAIRIDFQVVVSGGASDQDLAVLEKVDELVPWRAVASRFEARTALLNALNAFLPWASLRRLHIAGQWCRKNEGCCRQCSGLRFGCVA